MDDTRQWDIDRVAAKELFVALGLEQTPDRLDAAGELFARHRHRAMEWTASRAQACIVARLEARMVDRVGRKDEAWAEGVAFAEQQVGGMAIEDILGLPRGRPRSAGQMLRNMLRAARHPAAAGGR